jgi:hypothetical protein
MKEHGAWQRFLALAPRVEPDGFVPPFLRGRQKNDLNLSLREHGCRTGQSLLYAVPTNDPGTANGTSTGHGLAQFV